MRTGRTQREAARAELDTIEMCLEALNDERFISSLALSQEKTDAIRAFGFLTAKPALIVVNTPEEGADERQGLHIPAELAVLPICAEIEMEIDQLEPADRPEFMRELGIDRSAKDRIAAASYNVLGYHSFFTANEKEAHAWPLRKGADALEAAGRVHSDIARGFIKAEVVHFDDLRQARSMREVKARNLIRLEGKHYVVKDGDVIYFRFSV